MTAPRGPPPARNSAESKAYDSLSAVYESFAPLGRVKVPVVAAARGSVVAARMNTLLAADLRIVARDAPR